MINRIFLLLPVLISHLFSPDCSGQSWSQKASEKRHGRFNYDSNYVLTYKDRLHLSALLIVQETVMDLQLNDNKTNDLKYSTNNRLNMGFGIDYKWLSLETSFKVPFIKGDPQKGNTSVFNLRGNIIRQSFWLGAHIQVLEGFFISNPEVYDKNWKISNQGFPLRPGLTQYMAYFTGNYIFNSKRFSYKAYLTQFQKQRRSAGSFILGVTYVNYGIEGDTILPYKLKTPENIKSDINHSRIHHLGVNVGYLHTFIIRQKVFIHVGIIPSLGIKFLNNTYSNSSVKESKQELGVISDSRFALGRNGEKSYYGINFNLLTFNNTNPGERIQYTSSYIKLFYGRRF